MGYQVPSAGRFRLPVLTIALFVLFFASGALALVYQVVWTRMMTHVFGSTAVAVGTVLAAFMGGLAIGSWYFGRIADPVVDKVIDANPGQVAEYKAGKEKLIGFFVGQVMKETGGQANPGQVNKILKDKLSG